MTLRRFFQPRRRRRPDALPRWARVASGLVSWGPPVVLCVWMGRTLWGVGHLLNANLPPVLSAELSRQTEHEYHIGRVAYSTPGVLVIEDVAVSTRRTFAASHGEAALRAPRIEVHYSLPALIFDSGNALHALGDIILFRPQVLVERFAGNQFNFSDFLKPRPHQRKTKPFVGRVLARQGQVTFRDYQAPALVHERPALNTLTALDVSVDCRSERTVRFQASGQGTQGRLGAIQLDGDALRLRNQRFRVAVQAQDGDAAYWTAYFKAFPQARVIHGRADLDLTVSRLASLPPPGLPVDLLGRVTVRRAAIALTDPRLRRVPLDSINGTAQFTGNSVALQGSGRAAAQPLTISGAVTNFAHPTLALTVASARLDPAQVARAVPGAHWPAGLRITPGPASFQIGGTPEDPVVLADIAAPRIAYGGVAAALRGRVSYARQAVSIPSMVLTFPGGGQAAVQAALDLRSPQPLTALSGTARGIDLARVLTPAQAAKLGLAGRVSAAVLADSRSGPLRVIADLDGQGLHVRRTGLSSVRARVAWTPGGPLTIRRAVVRDPKGVATVAGTLAMAGRPWDLHLQASGLDLHGLLGPYAPQRVAGMASLRGQVVGAASAPRFVGQAALSEARYGHLLIDAAQGRFAASPDSVDLAGVTLRRFPIETSLSGRVTRLASRNPQFQIDAAFSRGDIQDFLTIAEEIDPAARKQIAGLPPLAGGIGGTVHLGGRLSAPTVSGHVQIADAVAGPFRIDSARADAVYTGGVVHLNDLSLASDGATLAGRGGWNPKTGAVSAEFSGHDIPLDRFAANLDATVDADGLLGISGTVRGTVKRPLVAATVSSSDLALDGQALQPLTLSGRYADGVFEKTGGPWRIALAQGTLTEYDIDAFRLVTPNAPGRARTPSVSLAARIPGDHPETVAHLLQTVRRSAYARTPAGRALVAKLDALPRPLSGQIAIPALTVAGPLAAPGVHAEARVTGLTAGEVKADTLTLSGQYHPGKDPSAHLAADAGGLMLAGVPLTHLDLDAGLAHRVVTVDSFRASSERAYLEASGRADLDGAVSASLDASNIPLSLFDPLLPKMPGRRGALLGEISAFTVSASGPTRSPNLTASLGLTGPGLRVSAPDGSQITTYQVDRVRSGAISVTMAADGTSILSISDLAAFEEGRRLASLSGDLPLRVGPGGIDTALPTGEPLRARLELPDLSLLASVAPGLDAKRTGGTLTASVQSLGGGGRRLTGTVDLQKASLALAGVNTGLTGMEGHARYEDGVLTLPGLTARSTRGGSLALTGSADFRPGAGADLTLHSQGFSVDETKKGILSQTYGSAVRGKIDGLLALKGPWDSLRLATPPAAPLLVSDASASLPSASPGQGTPGAPPPINPALAVQVRLGAPGKTVTVSNPLLRADALGDIQLGGHLASPDLRAHLVIDRGQVILPPATRLKFIRPVGADSNTVDLRYPVPSSDPATFGEPSVETRVDLTAQATVSVSPALRTAGRSPLSPTFGGGGSSLFGAGYGSQRYTITAHIQGLLDDPNALNLDLESDPGGLDRQTMLAALSPQAALSGLFGSDAGAAFQTQLASAFYAIGVPAFLDPFETGVAQSLGLSAFDIDYGPGAPVSVTLSKQLAPRLEATYRRSFGASSAGAVNSVLAPPQYSLKLGYALTRRLQLSVSTDDQRNNTVALEGVLNF